MHKKAYLTTLGCKVNQCESASFASHFQEQGVAVTDDIEHADFIVINTCTVTAKAGAQSRRLIRNAVRRNDNAAVIVTGCHAQSAAQEISEIASDRIVVIDNTGKDHLVSRALDRHDDKTAPCIETIERITEISRLPAASFHGRTRAFLRVQDGCNSHCSYCIVPQVRGRSRSLPHKEVREQARRFVAAGHLEIVVTGIHVGHYGADLAERHTIADLMEMLCASFPAVRFRLSSIEPLEISDHLLTLMHSYANFMPHLHIPLQSGDNEILALMNRRYTREQFIDIIARCRATLPDAAIGIDVLAGFPSERISHFNNTVRLLEQIDCTYLHVFPYSKRAGTRAASFSDQVDKSEKQRRVADLHTLGKKKKKLFYHRNTGTYRDVLVEAEYDGAGRLKGFTDNYIPIVITHDTVAPNSVIRVRLGEILPGTVVKAYLISEP